MGHGRAPPRRCLRKLVLHLDRDCALADAALKAQYLQLGRADRNKIGARGFVDQNGGITMTIRRAIRRDEFTGSIRSRAWSFAVREDGVIASLRPRKPLR
jgi:hypothetical protein